jgi:hypothetical protein
VVVERPFVAEAVEQEIFKSLIIWQIRKGYILRFLCR